MSKRDPRTPEQMDADDRKRRTEAREAALATPINLQELIWAIERVADNYGAAGNHDSDLISDAFRSFAKELHSHV